MVSVLLPLFAVLAVSVVAHPHSHAGDHVSRNSLPGTWYHARDHPVHDLFKRGGDGNTYPQVGSPEWAQGYPTQFPDSTKMPQAWKDALAAAVSAGKIPSIPPTAVPPGGGNPVYATGYDGNSAAVCSGTAKCRSPGDFWDSPAGTFGTGFDDGPYEGSTALLDFLQKNNEIATHFMIGINILNNAALFQRTFNTLKHDIAVHTWSHRYMTSLSNEDVVAELGYTMDIIHKSTGGRLPKYWRPPMGDSDNRVKAIAQNLFGLTTIYWNQDTEDWSMNLPVPRTNLDLIAGNMTKWLTGPKSPGLIILEHELSLNTTQGFINAYPTIKSNGWQMKSVAQLVNNGPSWQNAQDNDINSAVKPVANILAGGSSGGAAVSGGSSPASASAPASGPSGTASSPVVKTSATASASPTGASAAKGNGANQLAVAGSSAFLLVLGAMVMLA